MMKRLINGLAMLMMAAPLIIGCSIQVFATELELTLTVETQFDTTNRKEDGMAHFPAIQEKDGTVYNLQRVETEIIKEKSPQREILTLDGESFTGDQENHKPQERVEKDGKIYQLKEYELIDTQVEERTQEVTSTISYNGVEYIDTLPDVGEIEVEDENTHQKVMARLPYKSHTASEFYWDNSFSFPITIVDYDAESYTLGDLEIPKDVELLLYGKELLAYVGLSEEYYRVLNVQWDGNTYESNGEQRRDAVATGKKLVKDINITYTGQVTFEGIKAQAFNSVYEALPEQGEADTIYTIGAKATYEQDISSTSKKMSWLDWLKWLLDYIRNHPVLSLSIGLAIIIFAVVIILFILTKKRNDEGEEK